MEEPEKLHESSFFSAFSKILATKIPENQPPVLYKYKTPEKKIAEEIKKKRVLHHKKTEKLMQKRKNYVESTDVVQEKYLRKTALKGVIKLFNEIAKGQVDKQKKIAKAGAMKQSERFKRRMKRVTENSETRKMINYAVEKPKWEVLRDDFLKAEG
jgi:hypothetical protein